MTSILQSILTMVSSPWSKWNNDNSIEEDECDEEEIFYSCDPQHMIIEKHEEVQEDEEEDLFVDCINEHNGYLADHEEGKNLSNPTIPPSIQNVPEITLPRSASETTTALPSFPITTTLPPRSTSHPASSSSTQNLFSGQISNTSLSKHYRSTGRCPSCTQYLYRRNYNTAEQLLLPLTDFKRTFHGRCLTCFPLQSVDYMEMYYNGMLSHMLAHIGQKQKRQQPKREEELFIHDDMNENQESNLSIMYRYIRHTCLLRIINDFSKHDIPDVLLPILLSGLGRENRKLREEIVKKRQSNMKIMWSFLRSKQEILIHATGGFSLDDKQGRGEKDYCCMCGQPCPSSAISNMEEKRYCVQCKAFKKDYSGLIQDLGDTLEEEEIQEQILALLSACNISSTNVSCRMEILDVLLQSMTMHFTNEIIVEHGCILLAKSLPLCQGDGSTTVGIREKKSEIADAIHCVLQLHLSSATIQEYGLQVLTFIFQCVDNNKNINDSENEKKELRITINTNEILSTTMQTLNSQAYHFNNKIQEYGLRLISNILCYPSTTAPLATKNEINEVIATILNSLWDHNTDEIIQEWGIHTLYSLCRHPAAISIKDDNILLLQLVEKGSIKAVVNAMTTHVNVLQVQRNACCFFSALLLQYYQHPIIENEHPQQKTLVQTIQDQEVMDAISMSMFVHSSSVTLQKNALSFLYQYIKTSEACGIKVAEDVSFCMIEQFVREAKETYEEECGEYADYILEVLD